MTDFWVVIPAAGQGTRFSDVVAKQYMQLGGRTVLDCTIDSLLSYPLIAKVVIVLSAEDVHWRSSCFYNSERVMTAVGGETRAHSVLNGLMALQGVLEANAWVLVHDGCRPYVPHEDLDALLELAKQNHAVGGLLATPVTDTIKLVKEGCVTDTVARDQLWRAQTPQLFRYGLLKQALSQALKERLVITDEASAIEYMQLSPRIVPGSNRNIKITYQEDLAQMRLVFGS